MSDVLSPSAFEYRRNGNLVGFVRPHFLHYHLTGFCPGYVANIVFLYVKTVIYFFQKLEILTFWTLVLNHDYQARTTKSYLLSKIPLRMTFMNFFTFPVLKEVLNSIFSHIIKEQIMHTAFAYWPLESSY